MDRTLLEQSSVFQEFFGKLKELRKDADDFFHSATTTEDLLRGQGACFWLDSALDLVNEDEGTTEEEEVYD